MYLISRVKLYLLVDEYFSAIKFSAAYHAWLSWITPKNLPEKEHSIIFHKYKIILRYLTILGTFYNERYFQTILTASKKYTHIAQSTSSLLHLKIRMFFLAQEHYIGE